MNETGDFDLPKINGKCVDNRCRKINTTKEIVAGSSQQFATKILAGNEFVGGPALPLWGSNGRTVGEQWSAENSAKDQHRHCGVKRSEQWET